MRYRIAFICGIVFAYAFVNSFAVIMINFMSTGGPITAINVIIEYPILFLLVIPCAVFASLFLLLLAHVGYTRPTRMIGFASGALVGMFLPVLFSEFLFTGPLYATATIISQILFGWIGTLGGHIIASIFGQYGADGDRFYWEDFD